MNVKLGIAQKLTLVFILFAAFVLIGMGLLAYSSGRSSLRSATIAELLATAIEKEAGLNSWVDEKHGDISRLATDPQIIETTSGLVTSMSGSGDEQEFKSDLLAEFEHHVTSGEFIDLMLIDPDTGEVIAASNADMEGRSKQDQPYFTKGQNGAFIQNVYYSDDFLGPAMAASAPIHSADGQLLAVLAGRLNLEEMNTIIRRRTGLRQADDAFLINTLGQFITQPRLLTDPAVLQRGVQTPAAISCLKGNGGLIEARDYRGIPAIIVYRWMPAHRLCLIVKLEEAEAYAPVRSFGATVAGISALFLLAAALVATALAHTLTRPILRLQEGLLRFRRGERQLELPVHAADELGAVAQEFNQMAAALAEKEQDLREHAQTLEHRVQERTLALQETLNQLQRAEETGHIGSWEWIIPENRVISSQGLQTLLGLSSEEFGTTLDAYFERIHPEDVPKSRQALESAMRTGTLESEARILRADGQIRHLYARAEAIRDAEGNVVRMIGIVIDITERKAAEAAVRRSEARYRDIFNLAPVSIWLEDWGKVIRDIHGLRSQGVQDFQRYFMEHPEFVIRALRQVKVLDVNDETLAMFKANAKEEMLASLEVVFATDDTLPGFIGELVALAEGQREYSTEMALRTVQGDLIHTLLTMSFPPDDDSSSTEVLVGVMDITNRKQSEVALRENETALQKAQQVAHVGNWIWYIPENRLVWSDEMYRIFGIEKGTFSGYLPEVIERAIHPEDRAAVEQSNLSVIEQGKPIPLEYRIILPDSTVRTVWAEAGEMVLDKDGRPTLLSGIVQDITERKQAEMRIRDLLAFNEKILNTAPVGMLTFKTSGQCVYANENAAYIIGTTVEGLTAQNFRTLDSWKRSGLLCLAEEAIASGRPVTADVHHISTFGKDVWLTASAVTFQSTNEEQMLLTISDITERKRAEEALRLENERFMRFIDSNIIGIVIADPTGGISLANDYYLNLLGVSREDFLAGQVDWRKFTPEDWLPADEKALQELQERGICEPYEKEYIRADGTRVPVYLADAILPGTENQIAAFVLDISDRKRAELALQRTTDDLLRSNAELEQFAYVASHDLQEPLRMVSSYMQLLARRYQGRLDSDADEFIAFAVNGAKRMQNLINDLLAYSRVGTRGNSFTPVSMEYLLDEAIQNLQLTITESNATITHDPLPVVRGDYIQLAMVLQNLMGNAIKFRGSQPPCVHISAWQEEQEWIISVRDNGIGFDQSFAERIFVIFQRLNDRTAYPGTGIGLAICKRIILRHGGRIWVESKPSEGSVFYFSLPMAKE